MPPGAAGQGCPAAQGREAAGPKSAARRRAEGRMPGAVAERSAGHGWPKIQGSHGWRPPQSEQGFKRPTGFTAAYARCRRIRPPSTLRFARQTGWRSLGGNYDPHSYDADDSRPTRGRFLPQLRLETAEIGCAASLDGCSVAFTNTISASFRVFPVQLGGCVID